MVLKLAIAATAVAGFCLPTSAFESLPGVEREVHPGGVTDTIVATKEQTDGQIGMVILDNPAGAGPEPAIVNTKASDYWFVIDGTYEFHLGDKVVEVGPGALLVDDKETPHGYITKTAGHILSIFTPGGYEHFWLD